MANEREIKGRIKAVANIKRITKTMQMIATARFQASQKRAVATQPYTRKISELVGELAAAAGDVEHPLLHAPDPSKQRELLLVLTSNRGLCGGYNGNILRIAAAAYRELVAAGKEVVIEVVGKKGAAFCKFAGVPMAAYHDHIGDTPAYDDVEALAERYMKEFTDQQFDSVKVIYMAFKTMSRQTPEIDQLLPMEKPTAEGAEAEASESGSAAAVDYDFSPAPAELLGELLPITVKTRLFQCFNEAVVSEHIARMVAMKSATDAAGKMGKSLTRKYNRARQAAITTELSEIIAGAAALD